MRDFRFLPSCFLNDQLFCSSPLLPLVAPPLVGVSLRSPRMQACASKSDGFLSRLYSVVTRGIGSCFLHTTPDAVAPSHSSDTFLQHETFNLISLPISSPFFFASSHRHKAWMGTPSLLLHSCRCFQSIMQSRFVYQRKAKSFNPETET